MRSSVWGEYYNIGQGKSLLQQSSLIITRKYRGRPRAVQGRSRGGCGISGESHATGTDRRGRGGHRSGGGSDARDQRREVGGAGGG